MKIDIHASYHDWLTKADQLVEALIGEAQPRNPDLADRLEKALPKKEPVLKHRALRDMHAESKVLYREYGEAMLGEIMKVLSDPVKKSDDSEVLEIPETGKQPQETYAHKMFAKDLAHYIRVKNILKQYDYNDFDFDHPEGRLYGQSVNQLLEVIKDKQS